MKWSGKESIEYTMINLGYMVLKAVNWVHNDKLGQMILKGVNWVHNAKMSSYGLEMIQFSTQ